MTAVSGRIPGSNALAALPTPLTAAPRLAAELGTTQLYVKRDDLSGFAFAGTKARKLEFFLAAAREEGADMLLSGGSPESNFGPAVSAAARGAGLECHLLVAAAAPEPGAFWHPNPAAARAWGARLHWTETTERISVDAGLPELEARFRDEGHNPYAIPRGGATGLGAVGGVTAALELHAQCDELEEFPRHVVLPVGSGGTLAGLLVGTALLGRPWTLVGVSVSRPPDEAVTRVLTLAEECSGIVGAPPVDSGDVRIVDGRGPGHGRPSGAGVLAARLALETAGLVLDPVYTAKALAALTDSVPRRDEPVVFWHTGGLLGAVAEFLREESR